MKSNVNGTNYRICLNNVVSSLFTNNSISPEFPETLKSVTADNLIPCFCRNRKDLRCLNAFTIDSASSKDLDDAVSILQTSYGYRLGVHIADVSAYVPFGSELDKVACARGTSIYLPNMVVPMLPEVLSNDLCSLNANEDKFTISVILKVDHSGNILEREFTKGIIRSRVKGIYSEINELLSEKQNEILEAKYSKVWKDILVMKELAAVLRQNRIDRGARVNTTVLPDITVTDDSISVEPGHTGEAEHIIEEFMILANSEVAEYVYENELPAVYRIQEEKKTQASYSFLKCHHSELALSKYVHFTSPIRRVGDLKVHQVLSMFLNGYKPEEIAEKFSESIQDICDVATHKSRMAKSIERYCNKFCLGMFFKANELTRYTGKITGYDYCDRPIFTIPDYNIKVLGYSMINCVIGDTFSFRVSVTEKNVLLAKNAMKMATA